MRHVYFSVYNLAKPPFFEDTFAMVVQNLNSGLLCSSQAKKMVVMNYHSSGKYRSPRYFKNVKRLPSNYVANTKSWMTTRIFQYYLTQLVRKVGAKNRKYCFCQCATHLKNTTFLATSKFYFSKLTVPPSHSLWIWESSMHSYATVESSWFQRLQPW
jgi:hypothetical protein